MGEAREGGLCRVAPALVEVEIETREKHKLSLTDQFVTDIPRDDVRTLLIWTICANIPAPTKGAGKGYHRSVMDTRGRVVIDPAVLHGKPVIRGTRVPVFIVVGSLAGGMTFEDVQREYDLTAEDVRAALKFAADLTAEESFHPLPAT